MSLPQAGEIFDNFKVLKILGEGGMGQVFLAEDIKLSRKVALKFLGSSGGQQMEPKVLMRFENEAKILASLNHPNIVNIYTFGTYANIHYLAMEYVDGVTLTKVIEKKSFGVIDSINAIKQLLTGLAEAHAKGILHRDIKPANILVGTNNEIKIVDFGISKSVLEDDQKLTKDNHFIGTLNYMAPEILKGFPPTPASDIFSVGIVFYELITGSNPFALSNKIETIDKIRNEQLTLPESFSQLIPPELEVIINKLIAREKENRYQSCREALSDFLKIADGVLPDFHGVSLRPEVEVTNRQDSHKFLKKMGYTDQEIEIIVKLAVKLVELKAYNEATNDETVDMSSVETSRAVTLDQDSLKMAVENFESSKSQTRSISQDPTQSYPQKATPTSRGIPFPLYVPKFIFKWTIIAGFVALNLVIFSKATKKLGYEISGLEMITNFFSNENWTQTLEQNGTAIELDTIKQVAIRNLSSIPAGEKKPLPEGTRLKFKAAKFNSVTGTYTFNQTNTLVIKQIRGTTMYGFYQDGKTGKWSTQHLSANAFLPPLRWFAKSGFNIAVTPQGSYDDLYPITLGKSASFSFKTLASGGKFKESDRKCEVLNSEMQSIAGQALEVYLVSCTTQTDQTTETGKFYYAPAWNLVVKKEISEQSPAGKFEESLTLESIELPNKDQ